LEKIIEILKSYPLQTINDNDHSEGVVKVKRSLAPEIIISASFSEG
jgi:hypothetical protein